MKLRESSCVSCACHGGLHRSLLQCATTTITERTLSCCTHCTQVPNVLRYTRRKHLAERCRRRLRIVGFAMEATVLGKNGASYKFPAFCFPPASPAFLLGSGQQKKPRRTILNH